MNLKKTRLALYVILAVLLLSSAVATTYAKYASKPLTDNFNVYVTAGTISGFSITGGGSGAIVTPGTYVATENQTFVKLNKNSEDCFVFVKVVKSTNVENIMDVNVHSRWTQLDGHSDVYYMELSKAQIVADAADSDVASYGFFEKKANAIWVLPSATKAQIQAISPTTDKITFTAYAVQKTPGIMDAATAWAALNG